MNEVRYGIVNQLRVAQSFPATPRIMVELSRLLRDPNAALPDIAAHLKHDSTLAARLLRIANSAAFAQSEPVASIEDAAALIGFRDIHRLVGAVAVDQFSLRNYPLYGFTGPRLRGNAVLVAVLMEELANLARQDAPAAYSAGLFRSVGKLALARIADEESPVPPFQPSDTATLLEWERHTFGLASNDATAAILQEWRFPPPVTRAIAEHYEPPADQDPLASILNLAARLADDVGTGLPGEARYWRDPTESARAIGLDPADVQRAYASALQTFDQINLALG